MEHRLNWVNILHMFASEHRELKVHYQIMIHQMRHQTTHYLNIPVNQPYSITSLMEFPKDDEASCKHEHIIIQIKDI